MSDVAARPVLEPCPACREPLSATLAGSVCCPACGWTMRQALADTSPDHLGATIGAALGIEGEES